MALRKSIAFINFFLAPLLLLLLGAVLICPHFTWADAQEESPYLLGDFGGRRTALEEKGLNIQMCLDSEVVSNVSGGQKTGSVIDNVFDMNLTLDTEKAELWSGGQFYIEAFAHGGGNPSEYVGDYQLTSNIEADEMFVLYQAWYEHSFFDERLSFLAGVQDYNSEFAVLEYAQILLNSSFGLSVDVSQIPPSLYPYTGFAFRTKVLPSDSSYFLLGVYDGSPGDPRHPHSTELHLKSDDGAFLAVEAGLTADEEDQTNNYYKIGIGSWYRNGSFEDVNGDTQYNNQGFYLIAEKSLFHEDDPLQGLGAFLQLGWADASRNQTARYVGGGLTYAGLIPERSKDVASFGIASARNSNDYVDKNPGFEYTETTLEFTYNAQITPWFSLQPDYQYVIQPGMNSELDNASVLSLRASVVF